MSIEKNIFVLCENAIIDTSQKVTLVNIYDIIYAKAMPAVHGRFFFALNFKIENPNKEDKQLEIILSVKSPSGKELVASQNPLKREIDLSKKSQNIGAVMEVTGVVLEEYGTYVASVSVNSINLHPLYFEVMKLPEKRAD